MNEYAFKTFYSGNKCKRNRLTSSKVHILLTAVVFLVNASGTNKMYVVVVYHRCEYYMITCGCD